MRRLLTAIGTLACGCDSTDPALPDAWVITGDAYVEPVDAALPPDAPPVNGKTITLTLTNRPNNAAAFSFVVAYQDGSAAWRVAPPPTGDTYTFPVFAPVYAVAFMCISSAPGAGSQRSVTTAHFAVGERTDVTLDVPARCSDRAGMTTTLSGRVTNRPSGGVYTVHYGGRSANVGPITGNFNLMTPPGTRDLLVVRSIPQTNGDFYVDRAVVLRDVAVTTATTRVIDFSTSQSTASYAVMVNQPTATVFASTALYTANGTSTPLVRERAGWNVQALAAPQRKATDLYEQSIAVSTPGRGTTLTLTTSAPTTQTFMAQPALATPATVVASKQPYIQLETGWAAYASAIGYTWTAAQQGTCSGNVPCTITWTALLSPGVTGSMPGYIMPDLTPVTGWKPDFQFLGTSPITGNVTAIKSLAGPIEFPPVTPAAGTLRAFVRADFGVTP